MNFSIAIYHSVFIVDYGDRGFIAIPQHEEWTPIETNLSARLIEPGKVEFKVTK